MQLTLLKLAYQTGILVVKLFFGIKFSNIYLLNAFHEMIKPKYSSHICVYACFKKWKKNKRMTEWV